MKTLFMMYDVISKKEASERILDVFLTQRLVEQANTLVGYPRYQLRQIHLDDDSTPETPGPTQTNEPTLFQ